MARTITLIKGDGIGPEVTNAAVHVLEASGIDLEYDEALMGEPAIEEYGVPLPDETTELVKKNKVALKGPVITPIGTGFRSVNVALRQTLDLYACLRPCKHYEGVKSKYPNVDLVGVRENTEGLYAGVEFDSGTKEANELISLSKGKIRENSAISLKPISRFGSERIVRFAFDYAVENNRKKVTAVTKANIMKYSDGLFFAAARDVAKSYEGRIEYEERLIDNMCMQLVQKPEFYDVIVAPNLYGDILSDLCAGLVGGLGVAPGANIGAEYAVFEAVHGAAPKYKGMNKVNPSAMILSSVLMLRHLGEREAAQKIDDALKKVLKEGKVVTYDLGGKAGTMEMAQEIAGKIRR
ncbi:MAG: isocitrate/isopropylmalate dehydrogenase family protein [Candidatus Hydrothermarchaeales archaeon]